MHWCSSDVNVCISGLVMFNAMSNRAGLWYLRLSSSQGLLLLLLPGLYSGVLGSSRGRSWRFAGHVTRPVTSYFLVGKVGTCDPGQ